MAKNRERPFWIDTEQVKIEVLGTAFSVKSVEDAPFRLSVQRGTVRVTLKKGNKECYVKAGETVVLKDVYKRQAHNTAWKGVSTLVDTMVAIEFAAS